MRGTLIHNPKAGDRRIPDTAVMAADLEALGWTLKVADKSAIDEALRHPGDAVFVAGGDGTVGKVAKRLAGTGVPMAVIPTGTANNVARTLGIGVDARIAIDDLRRAVVRDIDLGVVDTSGQEERFLEGFGIGLFAWVMAERATGKHKKLRRALGLLAEVLADYAPRRARIEIDGRDASGEYLLASVMNLRSLGPALGLAPEAQPDDGQLDVVLVRPEHRESLLAHLRRAIEEGDIALPRFEVHRAEHVRISGQGKWAHVDDCPREFQGDVEVRVDPGAVKVFVPPVP
ncbi:MAG TPA: diacylglycerol kinase family protein [Polyangiaceae bacterium]|nr:diacylglycerol kinase family protein [Polyangiaceae bacterium]